MFYIFCVFDILSVALIVIAICVEIDARKESKEFWREHDRSNFIITSGSIIEAVHYEKR